MNIYKMFKKNTHSTIFLFAFILFSFNFSLFGQNHKPISQLVKSNSALNSDFNFWNDFNNGINDFGDYFTSPLRYSKNTWLKIGAVTAITGGLLFADNSVRSSIKKIHSSFQDNLVKIGDQFGRGIIPAGLSVALYGIGFFTNNYELKSTGQILFESLAAAGITVTVFKVIFGRSRPYLNEGPKQFNFFKTNNDFNSFPSGHVIVAFTTSTVLAEKINNIYASAALYGLAALTAYQRIYTDNHWFSDTFLAAAMGVAIGKYFVHLNENKDDGNSNRKISYSILPYTNFKTSGISFSLNF